MNLKISTNQYPNITEIWIIGSHIVEVATVKDNYFRVIAKENFRSGSSPNFYAAYEQLKDITVNDEIIAVWVRDHSLPWQDGSTIEDCITRALSWVNKDK